MHNSVKNCKIHHFANAINLLLTNSSLKKINRQVNNKLSLIFHWIRANKISLNTSKTEIIIFRPRKKQITKHLNFRISGQKSTPAVMLNDLVYHYKKILNGMFTSVYSNQTFSVKLDAMY